MIFGEDYAAVYDGFYGDKDYTAEVAFLLTVVARCLEGQARSVLDLGCGTGAHDIVLARQGLDVCGVDRSEQMLDRAGTRLAEAGALSGTLDLVRSDIRTLEIDSSFDLVVSLFHVMSYQTTDADVAAVLSTARRHLRPGGLLVFDFWHGPAVLAEPPQPRERTAETAAGRARRVSRPEWMPDQDLVRVAFDIDLEGPPGAPLRRHSEEHLMRYFFVERLTPMIRAAGLEVVEIGEWGTGAPLGPEVFGAYVAARAAA